MIHLAAQKLNLSYLVTCALQPQIAGSLGPIPNVPGSITPILDRGDRIQQSMSIGNLVS